MNDDMKHLSELDEWKQAASVEAGLRREFKKRADRFQRALQRIADLPMPDEASRPLRKTHRAIAISALSDEAARTDRSPAIME
ncbi:hypothetical protein [Tardiphaga sp. 367_B4_N1_1]|uniref:hypothetical protein n=1 Tax=Tardiphaga sp. 367_B4_N1_1 TaxID=3240777 RepID=UPI003F23E6F7